jgi:hypothetical protein
MGIVTRAEVKTYLQITTTEYDDLIDALLDPAEETYLAVRGIPFFTFQGDITNASAIIENIEYINPNTNTSYYYYQGIRYITDNPNNFDGFENIEIRKLVVVAPLDVIKIEGKVIDIDEDNTEITLDSDATETLTEQICTIYPTNYKFVVSKIVSYYMNTENMRGKKSVGIGTYNYTSEELLSGLPKGISGLITRYQEAK